MLSAFIPQCQFGYGMIAAKPVTVATRLFQIPLISTVIGVLIPADQFCLLPLAALNNLLV
jgi:hypothetical protein